MRYLLGIFSRLTGLIQSFASRAGFGLAFYWWIARFWRRVCGWPWAQRLLFGKNRDIVQRFALDIGLSAAAAHNAVMERLLVTMVGRSLQFILRNASREEWEKLVYVEGINHLQDARKEGAGVILTFYHMPWKPIFHMWQEQYGIPSGITIWRWAWQRSRDVGRPSRATENYSLNPLVHILLGASRKLPILRNRQKPSKVSDYLSPTELAIGSAADLMHAAEELDAGGIVHILADGHAGNYGIALPIFDRTLDIQPGFAELALATDARILPVTVALDSQNRVCIGIGAPFSAGNPEHSHQQQIRVLAQQYIDFLERSWHVYPGQLALYCMDRHLNSPRSESAKVASL